MRIRAVLVAVPVLLPASVWAYEGLHRNHGMIVGMPGAFVGHGAIQVGWRVDGESIAGQREVENSNVILSDNPSFGSTLSSDTEQLSHMDPDWENNTALFLLSPDEFAATRFSPSQATRPFHIRGASFVPEQATGSDAVLFFVAFDQAGYPGVHVFEGSIPVGIVNQFSEAFLHITFAEEMYFTSDFHFGVGTAPGEGDSLSLYSDTGGGDATHSLIYQDGTWYTMPDIGHSNSWIMQAEIEYQADADGSPQREMLQFAAAPNPFRTMTVLKYDLGTETSVHVEVLDVAGRHVKELFAGSQPRGSHELYWDGSTAQGSWASPGVYLCILHAGRRARIHTLVILE